MTKRSALRLYGILAGALLLAAAPASAQFQPRPLDDPATGEQFHVEGSAGFWSPGATISINASAALGIAGTDIDLVKDLGLTNSRFGEVHLVLRPARKHKLRMQYIPIKYQGEDYPLKREAVFQGQRYRVDTPVDWLVNWKAYRFAYEYDFISTSRGFGGVILDAKYTDVYVSMQSPAQAKPEFVHPRGPVPAIGGIARVYVVPNISITGELTGFTIPNSVAEEIKADGHYADFDLYGTVNFTNNLGAQLGYRSLDLGISVTDHQAISRGAFVLRGLYFGVVARY